MLECCGFILESLFWFFRFFGFLGIDNEFYMSSLWRIGLISLKEIDVYFIILLFFLFIFGIVYCFLEFVMFILIYKVFILSSLVLI